jgi:hypothetical protein
VTSIEPDQYRALYENGIIGKIEFLDLGDGGLTVTCGNFALALSAEQITAARDVGIELAVAPGEPLAPTSATADTRRDER